MKNGDRPNLTGVAGEYYVMSILLRQGFIAALAPTGVPNADIVVTNSIGDRLSAIQVKARRDIGSDRGWHMKAKHETIYSDGLFYCFVDFGSSLNETPLCWLVPSKVVAAALKETHKSWLSIPGKKGQQRKDGEMRRFLPCYKELHLAYRQGWLDQYRDAWQLLERAAQIGDK